MKNECNRILSTILFLLSNGCQYFHSCFPSSVDTTFLPSCRQCAVVDRRLNCVLRAEKGRVVIRLKFWIRKEGLWEERTVGAVGCILDEAASDALEWLWVEYLEMLPDQSQALWV